MRPLFTIITVTKNNAAGLRATLESIAFQTRKDYEIIIIDGHSTDATPEVLLGFAHLPVRCHQDASRGVYPAMNQGTKEARGEWTIFLNAGDRFFDSRVLAGFPTETDADLLYGRVWFDGKDKPCPIKDPEELWKGNAFCHQAVFTRTEILRRHPFREDLRLVSDYAFYVECLVEGMRLVPIDLDVAIIEPGGISMASPVKRTLERFPVALKAFPGKPVRSHYLGIVVGQITQPWRRALARFRRKIGNRLRYYLRRRN